VAQKILKEFPRARIDARGFIEETPVVFKRELFEVIAQLKRVGREVFEELLKPERLGKIKELAAKEEEYLPPPTLPEEKK
jgi:ectoine hydroxylase-related dioxygenase (phytanoyl-CoA dioxygenase family)